MEATRKIVIEVMAGQIPGQPLEEFTRNYPISVRTQENADNTQEIYESAQNYARSLWQPSKLTWVTLTWICVWRKKRIIFK